MSVHAWLMVGEAVLFGVAAVSTVLTLWLWSRFLDRTVQRDRAVSALKKCNSDWTDTQWKLATTRAELSAAEARYEACSDACEMITDQLTTVGAELGRAHRAVSTLTAERDALKAKLARPKQVGGARGQRRVG